MDGIDMTETDDGIRGEVGVVVSVRAIDATCVRLTFDRVLRDGQRWRSIGFSTFKDLPRETLTEMSISTDDLESFGLVLTAELTALLERVGGWTPKQDQ